MSEPTPTPAPVPQPAPAPARSTWKFTILLVVLLAGGAAGYYFYVRSQNPLPPPVDEVKTLREYAVRLEGAQKLALEYTDSDGDLVADPPKDAAKFAKVGDELVFSAVGTDAPEAATKQWNELMAALEKATGKKVRYASEVRSIDDQYAAVRAGTLHVSAFNTGAVPTAVSAAGFVPLFAPADASGNYGVEMQILVRADSPLAAPNDLKGKRVGFVALSSNSGAKAPLVLLREKFELTPARDYDFGFTGDHIRSVKELVAGKYDAVCVVNDLLHWAEGLPADNEKKLDKSKYKTIYTSESFPPLCFGVPHHLPPEVAAQVRTALAGFKFAGTGATRQSELGKVGFAPVNYKKDWEYVRQIDETLTRLFDRE